MPTFGELKLAAEVEVDLPATYQNGQILLSNYETREVSEKMVLKPYQNGQILISNYEDVEVSEKILLKPYQTLAIYVH